MPLARSTNAILLGNTQQSRASLFYISSYITKNKMSLEHCLSALSRAQAHIEKYPSKADDAGTKKRTIQHLMQRVLNTMYCHRELSDTQVALALLNGLAAEATSDSFSYYGAGYMNNFIDAELKQNSGSAVSARKRLQVVRKMMRRVTMSVRAHSADDSPSDKWGSIPNPKAAELGPAPFKRRPIPDGEEGEFESVPVHYQLNWRYRGKELAMMTPVEYYAVSQSHHSSKEEDRKRAPEEDEMAPSIRKAGRQANTIFRFAEAHPLHGSHCQRLRSKQRTLIHNGFLPKYPGPMPESPQTQVEDYRRHFKVWKQKADAFAKYYLCSFRPLETCVLG